MQMHEIIETWASAYRKNVSNVDRISYAILIELQSTMCVCMCKILVDIIALSSSENHRLFFRFIFVTSVINRAYICASCELRIYTFSLNCLRVLYISCGQRLRLFVLCKSNNQSVKTVILFFSFLRLDFIFVDKFDNLERFLWLCYLYYCIIALIIAADFKNFRNAKILFWLFTALPLNFHREWENS